MKQFEIYLETEEALNDLIKTACESIAGEFDHGNPRVAADLLVALADLMNGIRIKK